MRYLELVAGVDGPDLFPEEYVEQDRDWPRRDKRRLHSNAHGKGAHPYSGVDQTRSTLLYRLP